ncbi:hypothetical protein AHAS_Ahas10G0132100 [Arachis hypogaea]
MHWRGTPGAGRGMPVLKSRGDSQNTYMGMARWKLGVAGQYNFPENNNEGRATCYQRRAMPASKVTWVCHLRSQAWHAKLKKPTNE